METKKYALKLYLEGNGFRSIGRLMNVSNVTVLNWIRKLGKTAQKHIQTHSPIPNNSIKTAEIDEMWHFTLKKRKLWAWIAIDRQDQRTLGFTVGGRGKKSLRVLEGKLSRYKIDRYATDDWKVYKRLLPLDKHLVGKEHTTQIESVNANVRHYLARFRRRTQCYSKSVLMVELSLYLLLYRDFLPFLS